jgi:hypothetical protein
MMADVDYGFLLSGGVDSAVVSNILLPLYKEAQLEKGGEFKPIPTFTVGMENSPDVMAAKAVVKDLGGSKYINHIIRHFTPDEVFDMIPKIVYHMETYEAELIRSSIPNWFLAEAAAKEVKMVLTGEGKNYVMIVRPSPLSSFRVSNTSLILRCRRTIRGLPVLPGCRLSYGFAERIEAYLWNAWKHQSSQN